MCLDYFIYNLNKKTLVHQLSLMEKCPMLCNNLAEIALKFYKSGRPLFKGLYILMYECQKRSPFRIYSLRIISDEHDYVIKLLTKKYPENDILHYFSNSIIMVSRSSYFNLLLIKYDLITGKSVDIELENNKLSRICSDNKNLFVVSPVK